MAREILLTDQADNNQPLRPCLSPDATDRYHHLRSYYFLYVQSVKLSIASRRYEKFRYTYLAINANLVGWCTTRPIIDCLR